MNGSIIIGSKDSTNLRIQSTVGQNIPVLFGSDYHEQQKKKYKRSDKLQKIVDIIVNDKLFGEIDSFFKESLLKFKAHPIDDPMFVQTEFDEYCDAQEQVDTIFLDKNELQQRSMIALAKCGDLSCDNSIITLCEKVWSIKAVEVPNPTLAPGLRVRSHSYLHLQEGSLERGEDSYNSNMFNLEETGHIGENGSMNSKGDSVDKLIKAGKNQLNKSEN